MLETTFRRLAADERPCFVERIHRPATRLMVEERVVGNLEKPGAEPSLFLIARRREVGLHQRVLRQVVGIALLATAESEQEATEGLLLTLYLGYEYVACHLLLACAVSSCSSASISLASIFLPM